MFGAGERARAHASDETEESRRGRSREILAAARRAGRANESSPRTAFGRRASAGGGGACVDQWTRVAAGRRTDGGTGWRVGSGIEPAVARTESQRGRDADRRDPRVGIGAADGPAA